MEQAKPYLEVKLDGRDVERLVVIAGDLEYLQSLPTDRLLTHTEVRLAAGVLRRLLVDNELGKLWVAIRRKAFEPDTLGNLTVNATDLDGTIAPWPVHWVRHAWAGGGTPGGAAHHTGLVFWVVPKEEWISDFATPEEFIGAIKLPHSFERRPFSLDEWLRSTSIAIQTVEHGLIRISRRSTLKYVANLKGGVHFEPNRPLRLKRGKLERRDIENTLLDHGLLQVGPLTGPEFEVMSMVAAVREANWSRDIMKNGNEAVPEYFRTDPTTLRFWTGAREADGTGWATMNFGQVNQQSPSPD